MSFLSSLIQIAAPIAGYAAGGPLGIGAGLGGMLGGAFGQFAGNGFRLPGTTNIPEEDFNYDPQGLAQQGYDRISDPDFGLAQYERLGGVGAGGAAALQRNVRAAGGSNAMGYAQGRQQQADRSDQALDAYGSFRNQKEQVALGYLGEAQKAKQFQKAGFLQQLLGNAQTEGGFFNELAGAAVTLGANQYFNGQNQQDQQGTSYNTSSNAIVNSANMGGMNLPNQQHQQPRATMWFPQPYGWKN